MKELIQLKSKDLKPLKEKWHNEQNQICPVLKKEFPLDDMVIDHEHKLKSELPDASGKGCCRGAISRFANALEGKILNNFKRMGLDKHINLPTFLRNLADYLESNHLEDNILYIHPSEEVKEPKLKKTSYNKLKKLYSGKARFPEFPKSGKLTKQLEELFKTYNLEPEYYSTIKVKNAN